MAPLVREALRGVDAELPLLQPQALSTRIAQTVANRTSFTDTNLPGGTRFFYRVSALMFNGDDTPFPHVDCTRAHIDVIMQAVQ